MNNAESGRLEDMTDIQYVSSGQLPPPETIEALVNEAHARFMTNDEGENAAYYPALARVPRTLFGVCVVGVSGSVYAAGDTDYAFTIMSVAKPFTFALVVQAIGIQAARAKLGLNATGLPFNSMMAIELQPHRLNNPMVNPGAIAAVSLVPGETAGDKWQFILEKLSQFAGRTLTLNEEMFASAMDSNYRNRAIVNLMFEYDRLYFDPLETLDVYTRQSSLNVTAKDLAVMAATLADGGVNPVTHERVLDAASCRYALAVMATAGLYETSGDWLVDIGLPGKSGVGGGIITAAPGKGGLCTFSTPLDAAGNSIRGQLATRFLSEQLGLNLFASKPMKVGS